MIKILYDPLDDIILNFPEKIKSIFLNINNDVKSIITEILFRINKKIIIKTIDNTFFLDELGRISKGKDDFKINSYDIKEILKYIFSHARTDFQNQLKSGIVTLYGGHKCNIFGTINTLMNEIINITDVSSINLRIARQINECSSKIFEELKDDIFSGILIAGPSCSGKTTIIRDVARKISNMNLNGKIPKVIIIDKNYEIAAVNFGIPKFDLGNCDIISGHFKNDVFFNSNFNFCSDILINDNIFELKNENLISGKSIISSVNIRNIDEINLNSNFDFFLESKIIKKIVLLDENITGKIKYIF